MTISLMANNPRIFALERLIRATKATNRAFVQPRLLTTPSLPVVYRLHPLHWHVHVLMRLDCACSTSMQVTVASARMPAALLDYTTMILRYISCRAHGVCALESSSYVCYCLKLQGAIIIQEIQSKIRKNSRLTLNVIIF